MLRTKKKKTKVMQNMKEVGSIHYLICGHAYDLFLVPEALKLLVT